MGGVAPGWYPQGQGLRYHDGQQWTGHATTPPKKAKAFTPGTVVGIVGAVIAGAAVIGSLFGYSIYKANKPVKESHSDKPTVEAFFREIEGQGLGNMRVSDAESRAKSACDGNGLVLWGVGDYSMADSFNFAAAAMQACRDL